MRFSYYSLVTPTGFEPISSEPESEILSIELRSQSRHAPCGTLRVQIYVFSFEIFSNWARNWIVISSCIRYSTLLIREQNSPPLGS